MVGFFGGEDPFAHGQKIMSFHCRLTLLISLLLVFFGYGCAGGSKNITEEVPLEAKPDSQSSLAQNLKAEKAEFQRRVEANPEDWDSWNALGTVLYRLGEMADAEKALLKAHELSPKEPAVLSSLGLLRHRQGNHKEARALLEKAISLKPGHGPAHNNLGLVLVALNDKDAARSPAVMTLISYPN